MVGGLESKKSHHTQVDFLSFLPRLHSSHWGAMPRPFQRLKSYMIWIRKINGYGVGVSCCGSELLLLLLLWWWWWWWFAKMGWHVLLLLTSKPILLIICTVVSAPWRAPMKSVGGEAAAETLCGKKETTHWLVF